MTNEEQLELIKLKKENLRLQKALDYSQLHNLALETLIEIVEKSYGENLENISLRNYRRNSRKSCSSQNPNEFNSYL